MNEKKSKYISIIIIIFPILVICFVCFDFSSNPSVAVERDKVVIKAPLCAQEEMLFSDISKLSYIQDLDYGDKIKGVRKSRYVAGWFENSEYGKYYVVSYPNNSKHILIQANGVTFIFNYEKSSEIETTYKKISMEIGLD